MLRWELFDQVHREDQPIGCSIQRFKQFDSSVSFAITQQVSMHAAAMAYVAWYEYG